MSDRDPTVICASIDENVRRKRCRAALEDIRALSTHSRYGAISSATRACASTKATESESEDNKLIRASYEMIYAARQEGAPLSAFSSLLDQLYRVDINDIKVLPRRLQAVQIAALLADADETLQSDKWITTIRSLLREISSALLSDSSSMKLTSKMKQARALQLFSAPAVLSALSSSLATDTRMIALLDVDTLAFVPQMLTSRDTSIQRAVTTFLHFLAKTISAASATALNISHHRVMHPIFVHLMKQLKSAGSLRELTEVEPRCKIVHAIDACGFSSGCCAAFQTEAKDFDAIDELMEHVRDRRARISLAAIGVLSRRGLGYILRSRVQRGGVLGGDPFDAFVDVISTLVTRIADLARDALAASQSPLLAVLMRHVAEFGKAFCKFEVTYLTSARRHSTGVPNLLPLHAGVGANYAALVPRTAAHILRLCNTVLSVYIFCISSGNMALKLPAAMAITSLLQCVPLVVLTSISRAKPPAGSRRHLIQARALAKFFFALLCDARTRYSYDTLKKLSEATAEKCRMYARFAPGLLRLVDALHERWLHQSNGDIGGVHGWKYSNVCIPHRSQILPPTTTVNFTSPISGYDRSYLGLHLRQALLVGSDLPAKLLSPNSAVLLASVGSSDFAQNSSIAWYGPGCSSDDYADVTSLSKTGRMASLLLGCQGLASAAPPQKTAESITRFWALQIQETSTAVAAFVTKAPKARKMRDFPFGICSPVVCYPSGIGKQPLYSFGTRLQSITATQERGQLAETNVQSRVHGPFNRFNGASMPKPRVVSPVFALTRPALGLTIIDQDFVDSSKMGVERLVRRLHRCVGSFVVATASIENAAMLATVR